MVMYPEKYIRFKKKVTVNSSTKQKLQNSEV
jgi:hypothetical protein